MEWEACTEKQECQTGHMHSSSLGMAKDSPVLQPANLGLSTRSPALTPAFQTVLKLMIVSGSHCCLVLSTLIEPNIGVIIKESKSNITHQRAYQQMQQIQGKKKVQIKVHHYCLSVRIFILKGII